VLTFRRICQNLCKHVFTHLCKHTCFYTSLQTYMFLHIENESLSLFKICPIFKDTIPAHKSHHANYKHRSIIARVTLKEIVCIIRALSLVELNYLDSTSAMSYIVPTILCCAFVWRRLAFFCVELCSSQN